MSKYKRSRLWFEYPFGLKYIYVAKSGVGDVDTYFVFGDFREFERSLKHFGGVGEHPSDTISFRESGGFIEDE